MSPTKHGALKNGTPYQNAQILYFPWTELSDFLKEILKFVACFRLMVIGFQNPDFSASELCFWYSPLYGYREEHG